MENNGKQRGRDNRHRDLDAERYRDPDGTLPEWFVEFERCAKWIGDAMERAGGTHWLCDVADMVNEGRAHLWPGKKSAVVTHFINYPRMKALNFWLVGGDLDELQEMEPVIAAWGKAAGCGRLLATGRRGWVRSFMVKNAGYEPRWWVLAKEV